MFDEKTEFVADPQITFELFDGTHSIPFPSIDAVNYYIDRFDSMFPGHKIKFQVFKVLRYESVN